MTGLRRVDHCEPRVSENSITANYYSLIIRTTMRERSVHPLYGPDVGSRIDGGKDP
jgi:hypothetical protein